VAAIMANRWSPLARAVADELGDLHVDTIEEVDNAQLVSRLARARILLWPSRIEGHATIPWEARSVGCVPVALSTNRFAVGLTEAAGAYTVDVVEEMAPAIRGLLHDRERWRGLSERGREQAREESNWERYVERVGEVLSAVPARRLGREPLAGMGRSLIDRETERNRVWQERLAESDAELERVVADRDRLAEADAELERVVADRDRLAGELADVTSRLSQLERYSGISLARKLKSRASERRQDG
jgi:hypothetical protein